MSDTQSDNVRHCSYMSKLANVSDVSFLDVAMMNEGHHFVPAMTTRYHRCEPASPVSSGRPSPAFVAAVVAGEHRPPRVLDCSHHQQNATDLHYH